MPSPRKTKPELIRAAHAAKLLGMSRNGVLQRVARKRYQSKVVGDVTFIVVDQALQKDIDEATATAA